MIRRGPGVLVLLVLLPVLLAARDVRAQERTPVVRALLFYSPTCPHCEELINNRLPPLLQKYGESLDVIGINVATQGGLRLYQAAASWYMIGPDRQGVPTLIVGSRVLVGQVEIPAVLPQLTDSALAHGGIDWPEAPEIRRALEARGLIQTTPPEPEPSPDSARPASAAQADTAARADSTAPVPAAPADTAAAADTTPDTSRETDVAVDTAGRMPAPAETVVAARPVSETAAERETAAEAVSPVPPDRDEAVADTGPATRPGLSRELDVDAVPLTMAERFRLDPVGNGTAVAVIFVLTGILVLVGFGVGSARVRPPLPPTWLVPLLSVAGMAVAAYLAFVEVTGTEAVCGPVGDCNTVQQSAYARLFGVLPVGVLGLVGFAAILVVWLVALRASGRLRRIARLLAWAMAGVAALFSIYLTFLEPFVIGATCAWCLTSAVIAGLVLLATTPAAVQELRTGH